MLRQLRLVGLDPLECSFKMVAVGPLYPEQADMPSHIVYRDKVAGLERAVATNLRARGLSVLGVHHSRFGAEPEVVENVLSELARLLEI